MAGRWLKGLGEAASASSAARRAAESRLRDVDRAVRALAKSRSGSQRVRAVHFLRVATRRADAALRAFEPLWEPGSLRSARKALRRLRRAAAAVRDADVHAELIRELASDLPRGERRSAQALLAVVKKERSKHARALKKALRARALPRLRQAIDALCFADAPPPTTIDLARRVLADRARESLALADADLSRLPTLHELRLSLKRLRYGIEVFADLLDADLRRRVYPALERMQSRLGRVNDLAVLLERVRGFDKARPLEPALRKLLRREQARAVRSIQAVAFRRALQRCLEPGRSTPDEPRTLPTFDRPRTFAAIDVGSNAVRMRVERWDGTRRVLADARSTTRLGRGLAKGARLEDSAVAATAETLCRFAEQARALGADTVAAVATAAVREAANGSDLIELARDRAGLDLRVISAEEEACLGLRAAAHALRLAPEQRLALIDVGGGSVEVVISIRGLIVFLASMPLGAVRLTETFGGPVASSTTRFGDMQAAIDDAIDRHLGELRPALRPDAVVGAGGTFTTLGFVSRKGQPREPGPGLERVTLASLERLIERVRSTPVDQRAERFPGIPPDRADIIVAGLAVARAILRRLDARDFFVHEGGVREGMILALAEGHVPGVTPRAVARTAEIRAGVLEYSRRAACEQPHSAHVARLSLELFDRLRRLPPLAPALTSHRDSRLLLECAAHLHDAGCLVEYPAHHKHSQRMILHADLPGLQGDRRRVVAAVARYHRRSGPPQRPRSGHEPYLELPPERRAQVRALAAVLRVADGLDRAHRQAIVGMETELSGNRLIIHARAAPDADARAVRLGISAAQSKGDLLESVFGVRLSVSGGE